MNNNKLYKGVTLIEVMVAMFIISIIIMTLFSIYSGSSVSTRQSRWRLEAIKAAQKQMETFMAMDYYAPQLDPVIYATYSPINIETGDLSKKNGRIYYFVDVAPNSFDKKITVDVEWDED